MGTYENQLKTVTRGVTWDITKLDTLTAEMVELQDLMTVIAASPGWEGPSADNARDKLTNLRGSFGDIERQLIAARDAITAANGALTRADNACATLPDVAIPNWVYDEVAKATAGSKIWVPFVGEFYVETAISRVQEFFGAQREAAAHTALIALQKDLRPPREDLEASLTGMKIEWTQGVEEPIGPQPSWSGDDNGHNGWGGYGGSGSGSGGSGGGGTGGGGGGVSVPWRPGPPQPHVVICDPPVGWPKTTIGIDGEIRPGSMSGGGAGGGLGGLGSGGGGLGGGGLGSGLIGAGAGAGALAAGSKLASGGTSLFGGAGAAGGAAAGKSSSAMMGGAPGGGGGSEKEKRSSLGLVAPKLEDDEEFGPRSAAAGAGGRD